MPKKGRLKKQGKLGRKKQKLSRVEQFKRFAKEYHLSRKIGRLGGITGLASIPVMVWNPMLGWTIMAGGVVVAIYTSGGLKPTNKYKDVELPMTKAELRKLAQKYKREMKK